MIAAIWYERFLRISTRDQVRNLGGKGGLGGRGGKGQKARPIERSEHRARGSNAEVNSNVLMVPFSVAFILLLFVTPICIWLIASRESDRKERAKRWIIYSSLGPFYRLTAVALWSAAWEVGGRTDSKGAAPWLGRIIGPRSMSSFWVAPSLGLCIYFALFLFVSRRLLNEHWSTWGSIRLVWWRLVALGLPLLVVARGFDALVSGQLSGILWLALSGITALVGGGFLRHAEGMKLHVAKTGETKNRAFAIAGKMGVKIGRVFIVPEGKAHMTNAFASPYAVGVTDNLGKYLTRPQIDYVLAHEVAHAKKKHGGRHLLMTVGIYSLLAAVLFLGRGSIGDMRPLVVIVAIFGPVMAMSYLLRRHEYEADRTAVGFTHDPETAIRALMRLYRVTMSPANCSRFTQLFLSHPSLTRRVMAIAQAGQIPMERVNSILLKRG